MKQLVRGLGRSPGFFIVIILTLAAGIGANTAIFSVIRGILLRPLPYHEPQQLLGIHNRGTYGLSVLSALDYLDVRDQMRTMQSTAAWADGDANLTGAGSAERLSVGYVTSGFFSVLGVAPSLGRAFAPDEDTAGKEHVAVLSHELWQRRFGGDPAVVGRDVRLDNEAYRVVGVLPASYRFETRFDLYVPFVVTPDLRAPGARDQHFLRAVGRLTPGASRAAVDEELTVISARMRAAYPRYYPAELNWRFAALPLLDNIVSDVRPSLFLVAAAAGLVLLIVCANVASLLLARATTRQRELSIRAALGATRARLVGQLLGESLFLSLLGGALGVLVALWGTSFLLSLAPEGLPRTGEVRVDGLVLVFSVILTAVAGTIFGLVPAWSASRVDVNDALRAGGRGASAGKGTRRMRRLLVVGETALAMVLVTAAALVTRSFARVLEVDPGFQTESVLSLSVTLPTASSPDAPDGVEGRLRWYDGALQRLAALPGVTSVGAVSRLPLRDMGDRLVDLEGAPEPESNRPGAQYRVVTPGYLATMGIPLLRGRGILASDVAGAPPITLVSQSFARRYWPDSDAIGKRFRLSSPRGPWLTIVGIVGDIHDAGLDIETQPEMYMPLAQSHAPPGLALVVRGSTPAAALAGSVRAELERYDPQQPIYDVLPMSERLRHNLEQRRFVLVLFELFAGLALGLATLGLYGVLAQAVAERTREIGVRVALGATRRDVLGLVAREGAILVGVGVALGVAGGLAGARVLAHMLYDVSPTDPLSLVAAILLLAGASAVATWLPARRALRVDPMVALRDE